MQVSLDGIRKTHDEFRGIDGCFEKTIEFINLMVDLGIKVTVGTCIDSQTYEELKQLSNILKEIGVSMHRLSPISERGRAKENIVQNSSDKIRKVKKSIKQLASEINDNNFSVFYFEEGDLSIDYRYKHNCGLGQTNIKIDPDGMVYPCLMSDIKYANVNEMSLLEIQKKYSRIWERIFSPSQEACNLCENKELCNNCVNEAMIYCDKEASQFSQQYKELCVNLSEK